MEWFEAVDGGAGEAEGETAVMVPLGVMGKESGRQRRECFERRRNRGSPRRTDRPHSENVGPVF